MLLDRNRSIRLVQNAPGMPRCLQRLLLRQTLDIFQSHKRGGLPPTEYRSPRDTITTAMRHRDLGKADGLASVTTPSMITMSMSHCQIVDTSRIAHPISQAMAVADPFTDITGVSQLKYGNVGHHRCEIGLLIDRVRYIDRVSLNVRGSPITDAELTATYEFLSDFESSMKTHMDFERILLSIKNNLVLNLSSTNLTDQQVAILSRGVQFGLVGHESRLRECARTTVAINDFLSRLADRLKCAALDDCTFSNKPGTNAGVQVRNDIRRSFLRKIRLPRKWTFVDNSFEHIHLLKFAHSELVQAASMSHSTGVCNVSGAELSAFKQLKALVRSGALTIRKADKSRQFVILDASAYRKGALNLLADVRNYKEVPFNGKYKAAAMTIQAVKRFGTGLPKYLQDALLLHTVKPRSRQFYVLPKTHKDVSKWVDGIPPFRPICPDVGTESSISGRFVASHLQYFVQRAPTYFKNAYSLLPILKGLVDIPESAVFLTGDIDSLYPNVPPEEALEEVTKLFDRAESEILPADLRRLIVELLRCQLYNNFFEFGGKSYLQVRGVPMGKPWAPAVACIYMNMWDVLVSATLPTKPRLFVRYVDDLLFLFDCAEDARVALGVMQSLLPNIKLGEHIISRQVHFLDLELSLVPAGSGLCSVSYSIYRKPCDLRVLLDFSSAHSLGVKLATVFSQCVRIWRLCDSTSTAVREIRVLLAAMVRFRHLPAPVVTRLLRRFRWWALTSFICKRLNIVLVPRRCKGARRTICTVPPLLHTELLRRALSRISSRLSAREQQWTGRLLITTQSASQLGRLLF
jgi:hypothetical protein